ncbi:cyclin-like protein [Backusella circina FSU 941]|nr:cyclin-like protein [Backusella circina FSU 941]
MNSDQWYFTKDELSDTPSVHHGFSAENELLDRTKGCHYLLSVGAKLNLPQLPLATATTFFHRFYMRQSMKHYHVYDIAATCLFVATKVEECTRRMKDIVVACAQKAQKNDRLELSEDSKDFIKWKDTLLRYEVILLETLCFDLAIQHPHSILVASDIRSIVSDSILKKTWMFLYQLMGVPYCVLYRPDTVAAAALLLGIHCSSLDEVRGDWWDYIHVDIGEANELAAEMVDYVMKHYLKKQNYPYLNNSQNSVH